MLACEAFAIEGDDHFIAEDFDDNFLPGVERDGGLPLTEHDGLVGAAVVVVRFFDGEAGFAETKAADVVFGIGGADGEAMRGTTDKGRAVHADFTGNNYIFEDETVRGGGGVFGLQLLATVEGAVDNIPVTAAGSGVVTPGFEAAGEAIGLAIEWRERSFELLVHQLGPSRGHEGDWWKWGYGFVSRMAGRGGSHQYGEQSGCEGADSKKG